MATSYEELIAAKKEAVGLQLEAAYRARLQDAYTQVRTVFRFHVKNIGAQCTCGKTRNSLSPNFFRQINSLVISLVNALLCTALKSLAKFLPKKSESKSL